MISPSSLHHEAKGMSWPALLREIARSRENLIDSEIAFDDARADLERDFDRVRHTARERDRVAVHMAKLIEVALEVAPPTASSRCA